MTTKLQKRNVLFHAAARGDNVECEALHTAARIPGSCNARAELFRRSCGLCRTSKSPVCTASITLATHGLAASASGCCARLATACSQNNCPPPRPGDGA